MHDGDRHVIKGRGPHRGKYLCWERQAPEQPATEDGFVWLVEQRKAVRWPDPRYSGHSWATDRACLHNGFFVKLVAPKAIIARVDALKSYIHDHAARATPARACWWFDSDFREDGSNYCRDCAEKLVDERYTKDPAAFDKAYPDCEDEEDRYDAVIDGGFDIDHDGIPTCDTCGAKLSGFITDYGVSEEIAEATRRGYLSFNEPEGWDTLERAIVNVRDDDPRWRRIARVIDAAMVEEAKAARAAAELSASPGMAKARDALVAILRARAAQKAHEPSYRLWTEMRAWRALDREKSATGPEAKALERRLVAEAKSFASCLGFGAYWHGGLLIIKAPYGEYYWPFVVEIEQYRLWNPPAFQEGVAYVRATCPSGDPEWPHHRDANPYPADDVRHHQWDAGFMSASTRP
jgi:hypothetical protein